MTFALLIYRSLPPSEALSESEESAVLAAHTVLQAEASAAGELHAVARLHDSDTAKTVRPRKGAHEITDGPYAETKEWLVGFYVVDCEDEDQAVTRAARICPDEGHFVEVRPVRWKWEP